MAKDAHGHGSNAGDRRATRLANNAVTRAANQLKGSKPSPYSPITTQRMNGSGPVSSNAAAASALASGPKSAPAPVHEAMTEHGVRYQPGVTGGALSLHNAYGTDWKKHDEKVRSNARRRFGSGPD